METILLSIRPEYVELILLGTKQYEYRRKLANKPIGRIVIYATNPVMHVVGEVQVLGTFSDSPSLLWEQTKSNAGISRAKYRDYFRGCETAYAYRLGKVTKYAESKKLIELDIKHPPQSFVYLTS